MNSTSFSLYSHFASALVNDDRSGLTEEDETELDYIIQEITEQVMTADWHITDVSKDSSFSRPEIALNRNIWGDCADFTIAY